ncbi:MAG: isoprenylcysteine carboxylmethyltransferase family protein [Phycisphaerae bacterium]
MTTWFGFIFGIAFITEDLLEGIQPHQTFNINDHWGIIGLALVVIGVFLRSWSAGILHKSEILTMTGPYALMRHPLYIGSFLIGIGFCTVIGDYENFLLVLLLLLPLHVRKARREERKLLGKFGSEWTAYAGRVGAFYPKSIPVKTSSSWSFSQWVRNTEYGAFVTSILGLAAMQVWHIHSSFITHMTASIW